MMGNLPLLKTNSFISFENAKLEILIFTVNNSKVILKEANISLKWKWNTLPLLMTILSLSLETSPMTLLRDLKAPWKRYIKMIYMMKMIPP